MIFRGGGGEFKEFLGSDIFIINPTSSYPLQDGKIISKDGYVPFVTTTVKNNGVVGYSALSPNNKGLSITASDTTVVEAMFYQKDDYIGRSHVQSLRLLDTNVIMTEGIGNYLVTAMIKAAGRHFNYANKFNRSAMYGLSITLPVGPGGNPNWDYMDKYISNMKLNVVNKLISDNDTLVGKLKELK